MIKKLAMPKKAKARRFAFFVSHVDSMLGHLRRVVLSPKTDLDKVNDNVIAMTRVIHDLCEELRDPVK
jgi:hypothetical protein